MSTDLVHLASQETGLVLPADIDNGLASQLGQIKVTNIAIAAGSSRNVGDARVGEFYNTQTKEVYGREINLVLLDVKLGRVMFPGQDTNVPPVCRSSDGLFPSPYIKSPKARKCGFINSRGKFQPTCYEATWKRDEDGKNIKPKCADVVRLLLVHPKFKVPYYFNVKRTAIPAWEDAKQVMIQTLAKVKATEGITLRYCNFWLNIVSQKVEGAFTYYVPRIKPNLVIKEERAEWEDAYAQYAAARNQAVEDEESLEQSESVDTTVEQAVEEAAETTDYVTEV